MTHKELMKKHGLIGRCHGSSPFIPIQALSTPELIIDLNKLDVRFEFNVCDNREHEDFDKPILLFTLCSNT